jgi:hypothetical protein
MSLSLALSRRPGQIELVLAPRQKLALDVRIPCPFPMSIKNPRPSLLDYKEELRSVRNP